MHQMLTYGGLNKIHTFLSFMFEIQIIYINK